MYNTNKEVQPSSGDIGIILEFVHISQKNLILFIVCHAQYLHLHEICGITNFTP